jgi:hypothetical protein
MTETKREAMGEVELAEQLKQLRSRFDELRGRL